MKKTIVLSLGGSLIVPDNIDTKFLTSVRALLLKFAKKGYCFVICCGGGKLARDYISAAKNLNTKISQNDLDWVGTMATFLNAELVRGLLGDKAHKEVIHNPHTKVKTNKPFIIASGWKPGWSTDYDAVVLAKTYNADTVINMSNIDVVYDKDPKKFKSARPLKQLTWPAYRKISGNKWSPGLNLPFDPVAAKEAQKTKKKVIVMNGKKLKNLENFLLGKSFKGTLISD